MSDPVDRIAAVLREHSWFDGACTCGLGFYDRDHEFAAHVAERIPADRGPWSMLEPPPPSMDDMRIEHRWVSAWSRVQPPVPEEQP